MPEFKPSSTQTTCWAYKTHSVCVTECVITPPGDFTTWSDQTKAHKAAVKTAMDPSLGHPPSPDCVQPVPGVQGTGGKKSLEGGRVGTMEDKPTSTLKTCWAYKVDGTGGSDVCINTCITTPPETFATLAEQTAHHKLAVDVAMDPDIGNPPNPDCPQPVAGQGTGDSTSG